MREKRQLINHGEYIDRRQFLTTSTMALTGASLINPSLAFGKGAKNISEFRGIELAIATICCDGFANKHHGPSFDLLPLTKFKNVEFNLWYPDTITPKYIASIKNRCDRTGLIPISLQGSGFGGEGNNGIIKDLSHKLSLMHHCEQLGCRRVKFTGSRRGTQGGLDSIITVLKELAPAAEDMGILILLENHANNVLERIGDYETIFDQIDSPNVGLCLDTGHFEGVDISLNDVLEKFHSRTLHVDLKDCRKRGAGHDTVVFGQGVTDFDRFLKQLVAYGYSGYLVIEQAWREPKKPLLQNLRAAYDQFQTYETYPAH
ncbi:sugar phosphate isomerase/epimerase [bacterium]|jgi:sugar phosphate isomerase/epimerase|nr:sugar phosphate isomerase/epimerase [bacterium]